MAQASIDRHVLAVRQRSAQLKIEKLDDTDGS